MAQLESARLCAKEQVGGSNPLVPSKILRLRNSTDLECKNSNLEAAGSNPAEAISIADLRFGIADFIEFVIRNLKFVIDYFGVV